MNVSVLIRIIIGLAFFQGVAGYIGLPSSQFRAVLEFCILMLFLTFIHFVLLREKKSFRTPGLMWVFIFTFSIIVSVLVNNSNVYLSIKMYNRLFIPYLFFLSILNINLTESAIQKINRFIFFMVILQIPAAVYKYLTYGIREGVLIGTFETQAGALSTIFPLIIIGYLIALYYCFEKRPIYLFLSVGFMFFAWGGGKRAFFIFLPGLIFMIFIIYHLVIRNFKINALKIVPYFSLVLLAIGLVIYLGGRLNPVFNPEKQRWGSFDLSYMITQSMNYQTGVQEGGSTIGRISTFKITYEQIIRNGDLQRQLLGDGPDKLDKSEDQRWRYGIRYGISGLTFNLISSGLLGSVSFFLLFLTFGIKAFNFIRYSQNPFYVAIAFGNILAVIVFCFDFLFYSVAFFTGYIPILLFYYSAAILYKQEHRESTSALDLV